MALGGSPLAEAHKPLTDVYWEVMTEEPGELEPFLRRVAAGEFGAYGPREIRDFLQQVEQDILGSIATKAGALALPPGEVEERSEETRRMIEGLIRKYAADR
jgi:hypothetical protein